jgi:hypothetical protein
MTDLEMAKELEDMEGALMLAAGEIMASRNRTLEECAQLCEALKMPINCIRDAAYYGTRNNLCDLLASQIRGLAVKPKA